MATATIALPARRPPTVPIRRAWREPAWWLFAGLITFGLIELFAIFGPGAVGLPASLLFAAVLFGLHGALLICVARARRPPGSPIRRSAVAHRPTDRRRTARRLARVPRGRRRAD
jgi:hypothetical protein